MRPARLAPRFSIGLTAGVAALAALSGACRADHTERRHADALLPPVSVPAPALLTSRDSSRIPPGTQLALDSAQSMTPPFTEGHAPRPSTSSAATTSPVPVPYKPSGPPTKSIAP
jgi:hypothetical protein